MPEFPSVYLTPKKLRFKTRKEFKLGGVLVREHHECETPISRYKIERGYNDNLTLYSWHLREEYIDPISSVKEGKELAQRYYDKLVTSCCRRVEVYNA